MTDRDLTTRILKQIAEGMLVANAVAALVLIMTF
jgi:hypothetical protein